jgi:hypothetical protein
LGSLSSTRRRYRLLYGSAVAALGRRTAYVAVIEHMTFVYDERCEKQDVDELRKLAKTLSDACGVPAMAALNRDDDVLWLVLAGDGRVLEVYNSFPGYFDSGSNVPEVANVAASCDAFDAPEARDAIETLLQTPHAEVTFEVQRHQELLEIVGINEVAGAMGFNDVAQGELEEAIEGVELHEVGGEGSS